MCTRFVPEQVVEQVLSRTDVQVGLGGMEVAGTIVFIDLRGFTTFAESRPAGQVIRILNHYLTEISCAILAHNGNVNAYIGDGLMAVFADPGEGVAAAREACTRIGELELDGHRPALRAGVHTGRPTLTEDGYVGLAVNTVARVGYVGHGGQVLVTGQTRSALDAGLPGVRFKSLGRHRLSGLSQPVALYEVRADGLPAGFPPLRTG
jgi:class 3 adenylate cyclase